MNQRELFLRHIAQTSDLPLLGVDMDVDYAAGIYLFDKKGRRYTDLISGISVSNVGHCHPEVVKAIHEQSSRYMHLMVFGEFNQSPQVKYAHALSKFLPPELNCVYFTTGGSEATEGALKLAKRATGRKELISFKKAYHGSTHGALSMMGDEYFKNSFRPLLPQTRQIEFNSIKDLEAITFDTAAVIVELIQGEAGVVKGEMQFITALRRKCSEKNVLLIVDEIQTGFGRTGTLFAFEQYKITPDILLVAKGMGGGLPVGAFVASSDLMKSLSNDPVLGHINTFGGNAVCVSAAQATLELITREKLYKRAKTIDRIISERLNHPLIKEIRTAGALGAIDFGDETLNMKIIRNCLDNGIITDWFLFRPTAMRIAPPLIITDKELNETLDTLLKILDKS